MLSRQDNNFQDKKTITTFGQIILPLTIIIALALMFFSVKLFFYTPMNPVRDNVMEEESKHIEEIIKDKKEKKTDTGRNNMDSAEAGKVVNNNSTGDEYVSINPAKPIKATASAKMKTSPVMVGKTAKWQREKTETSVKKESTKANKQNITGKVNKQTTGNNTGNTQGTQKVKATNKKSQSVAKTKSNTDKKQETKSEKKQAVSIEAKNIYEPPKAGTIKAQKKNEPDTAAKIRRWDVQIGGFSDKKNAEQLMQKAKNEGYNVYINEGTANNAPYYKIRVRGTDNKEETDKLSKDLRSKGYPVYLVVIE